MYFHSFPFRDASTKGKPSPSSFQSRTQSQDLENLHQTQFFPDTTCIWVGWSGGGQSFHLDFFLSYFIFSGEVSQSEEIFPLQADEIGLAFKLQADEIGLAVKLKAHEIGQVRKYQLMKYIAHNKYNQLHPNGDHTNAIKCTGFVECSEE